MIWKKLVLRETLKKSLKKGSEKGFWIIEQNQDISFVWK